jgi:hypothetical protein
MLPVLAWMLAAFTLAAVVLTAPADGRLLFDVTEPSVSAIRV